MRINRDDLLELIGPVSKTTDPKSSIAILGCILFQSDGDCIRARATNLEVAIERTVDVQTEPISFCVDAKRFVEIIKALPSEKVDLRINGGRLEIESGRASFKLPLFPEEDFPGQKEQPWKFCFSTSGSVLANVLSCTTYALAKEESRFVLCGLCLEFGQKVQVIASDGHRLAKMDLNVIDYHEGSPEGSYIIPRKACEALLALAKEAETVTLSISDEYVEAQVDDGTRATTITARLIDGQYPNWQAVIPEGEPAVVYLDKTAFRDALKRISLVTIGSKGYQPVRLIPDFDEASLRVEAQENELGQAREVIPAEYQGQFDPLTINARYLLDALNAVSINRVAMFVHSSNLPILIRDGSYLVLIMSMRE